MRTHYELLINQLHKTVQNIEKTTEPCIRRGHAPHKARSRPPAKSEGGGGALRPGVGSPLRTRALARCTQQESTVYQRRVSSDGSSSKNSAFIRANFLMKLTVSFAMKPCLSNARARKLNGCNLRPVSRSKTGCSAFLRRAQSSATFPALFSQPWYVRGLASLKGEVFRCLEKPPKRKSKLHLQRWFLNN